MIVSRILAFTAAAAILAVCETSFAQVGQLGGGAAAGGAGGGAGGAAAAAGDTTAAAGATTQGIGGAGAVGDLATFNLADIFVGGNNLDNFVGSSLTTQRNNNRQFQQITNTDVPTGGTRETSGTPRSVPTSLRVSFAYPSASGTSLLAPPQGEAIIVLANVRPEFRQVGVTVETNGVATLTGIVPDAETRRLAANLVRMRPGVRTVDNQIAVAGR